MPANAQKLVVGELYGFRVSRVSFFSRKQKQYIGRIVSITSNFFGSEQVVTLDTEKEFYFSEIVKATNIPKNDLDISQNKIIEKVIAFMRYEDKSNGRVQLSAEEQEARTKSEAEIRKGLCRGFSIVYAYMATVGKEVWWKNMLDLATQWDEQEASLSRSIIMPEGTEGDKQSTHYALLRRIAHYVLYNFAGLFPGDAHGQYLFLREQGSFDSTDGPVQFYQSYAGCFDFNALYRLFSEIENAYYDSIEEPLKIMVLVGSYTHSCALTYSLEEKSWYFYDPNHPKGELCFDKSVLVNQILENRHYYLGEVLSIEIAAFKKPVGFIQGNIKKHAEKFYNRIFQDMNLFEKSFLMILMYSPNVLEKFLKNSEITQLQKKALFQAIRKDSVHFDVLHFIFKHALQLLELAQDNFTYIEILLKVAVYYDYAWRVAFYEKILDKISGMEDSKKESVLFQIQKALEIIINYMQTQDPQVPETKYILTVSEKLIEKTNEQLLVNTLTLLSL